MGATMTKPAAGHGGGASETIHSGSVDILNIPHSLWYEKPNANFGDRLHFVMCKTDEGWWLIQWPAGPTSAQFLGWYHGEADQEARRIADGRPLVNGGAE